MPTRNPNRYEIMLLAMQAKMGRDFTIDFGKGDKIGLKYGDRYVAKTSNQTKKLLLQYIWRNELTGDLRFQMRSQLREHDEWYWKKLYEYAVINHPNTHGFREQHDSFKALNFNSSLFWDERSGKIELATKQLLGEEREIEAARGGGEETREEDTSILG